MTHIDSKYGATVNPYWQIRENSSSHFSEITVFGSWVGLFSMWHDVGTFFLGLVQKITYCITKKKGTVVSRDLSEKWLFWSFLEKFFGYGNDWQNSSMDFLKRCYIKYQTSSPGYADMPEMASNLCYFAETNLFE